MHITVKNINKHNKMKCTLRGVIDHLVKENMWNLLYLLNIDINMQVKYVQETPN